jgi:hypothetical protein
LRERERARQRKRVRTRERESEWVRKWESMQWVYVEVQ